MAKSFGNTEGQAKKGGEYYKWVDGDQVLRLVGDIVPRYVYWRKDSKGNNISIECLHFDRDQEKFTKVEKDWFQEYFPDQKCGWAYVGRAIHPEDEAKTILIPLKKKLYGQIQEVAKELGDPTDVDTGWDLHINRAKTGAAAFNVEYTLKQLKCKASALSDTAKETVKNMPSIDDLVPRPTPEEQKAYIEQMFFGDDSEVEESVDKEAVSELEEV